MSVGVRVYLWVCIRWVDIAAYLVAYVRLGKLLYRGLGGFTDLNLKAISLVQVVSWSSNVDFPDVYAGNLFEHLSG